MRPEEWKEMMLQHLFEANGVEVTAEDQRMLFSVLSEKDGVVMKGLIAAFFKSVPSAASLLSIDLATPAGVQMANRLQGRASGVGMFLDCLFSFAAASLGASEEEVNDAA